VNTVEAADRGAWRAWLAAHGDSVDEAWLVLGRGGATTPRVSHRESIEEALAAGWIDSLARRRDDESWILRFTPRTTTSAWSLVNHEIVASLVAQGLMTPRGQAAVDDAKRTGMWSLLIDAQRGVVPDDLRAALDAASASAVFDGWSHSARRAALEHLARARRPATRERRIAEIVARAGAARPPPRSTSGWFDHGLRQPGVELGGAGRPAARRHIMTVVMVDRSPRERIVRSAALLFRERGVGATGMREIVAHAQAPRGSLQHYFPGGKQELVAEAMAWMAERAARPLRASLDVEPPPAPGDVVRGVVDRFREVLALTDFDGGCPIVAGVADAAWDGEVVATAARDAFALWLDPLAHALRRGGIADDRADRLALMVISAVEGALVISRARRDESALDAVQAELDLLLAAG